MQKEILFCNSGGCTAKLGAGVLERILSKLPQSEQKDENLLIGYESADDAAVYRISDEIAIVQTLDFFPPMVDDPYLFGQIAATNALSDIYAMGGDVKTALNIVCFPENMDLNILGKILQGGSEKVMEAGGTLVGGHSIADDGVKYGLSVMGTVHPERIFANDGVQEGDALLLTKPLGVGIVCMANRMQAASAESMQQAIQSMTTLNQHAAQIIKKYDVHGCTDVTGFGFLGHLKEMLAKGYSAEIDSIQIPYIQSSLQYADDFYLTAAAQRNRNYVGDMVIFEHVPFAVQELLFDPQTSGGLLVSMGLEDAKKAMNEMQGNGFLCEIVGRVTKKEVPNILVR